MTNTNDGSKARAVKSRLVKRLESISLNKAVNKTGSDKRSLLITTHFNGQFKTETVSFDQLENVISQKDFFPGYYQDQVHTISSLVFRLSEELSTKFESMYSNITHWCSVLGDSKSKTFIVPLSKDLFDQQTLNKLLDAINFQIGSEINITFDTLSYNPLLHFTKLHNTTFQEKGAFLDVDNTIKRHKNQLKQSSGQKNIEKLEQLKKGLYTVNRFNNEAEASYSATQKNVYFLKSPEPLKAPYSLKQVSDYASNLDVAAQMALGLGIKEKYLKEVYKGQHTSSVFSCLINDGGDAVVYINRNVESKYFGKLGYKSLATGDRFSMAELYSKLLSPDEDVNKPTLMALQMKLLDEVGLIRTTEMEIKVPKDLTPKQLSVLHGFNQLLRLKQAVKGQESDPILFTYSFASLWCSVSRITATSAIKKLVKLNIIYIADQAKHLVQYLFTQFKTIKEVVKDSLVQTKAIKEFISEDIKEKYRQSKGYVKKASKLNQESLKSLQKIGNKGFQEKGEGLRKQKGVFTAMNTPKKINFRQATLLKKMIPQ